MVSCAYPDTDLTGEPSLEELLAEPIVRLIMTRDRVEEREMRSELERIKGAFFLSPSLQ